MTALIFSTAVESLRLSLLSSALALPMICLFVFNAVRAFQRLRGEEIKPLLAPHSMPLIGHVQLFLAQPAKLASVFSAAEHSKQIFRFKVPFASLWFVKGPSQIVQIMSDSKTFDFEPMKNMALQRILGLPSRITHLANRDDSGVGRKPLPGSNVPHGRRCNYLERQATKDFTRPASHATFVDKFEANLYDWVEKSTIGDEWVSYPDLYPFIRTILFRATTDAFYGPQLLKMSPHLEEDIWKFDANVPFLAKGFPGFLNRSASKIRNKCTQAFRMWRASALQETAEQLPEWNEKSGLKTTTLRKEVFEQFEEWDDTSCAASDLAVLFGLTSNSIRASFWFFLETLRSPDLASEAAREISSAVTTSETYKPTHTAPPRFDIKQLVRLPLLQSLFAETLRMYVSVMIVRTTRQSCKLGDWAVQKDQKVMMCNYAQHMDEKLWNPDGSNSSPHTLDAFWGRRFLTEKPDSSSTAQMDAPADQSTSTGPQFAGEGLGAKFFPFGMGERVCPGRHFSKIQSLLAYALISKSFDIELLVEDGWKPRVDWNHFGYGTLPPAMSTPFRIRRKAAAVF